MKEYSIDITKETEGLTVKELLLKNKFSVTLIKRVKYGGIKLNGIQVTVRERVSEGDKIEVTLPDVRSGAIEPMDIPIRVLYEDEYVLALDKPSGMPTHPSKGNSLPTLANAVMGKYKGDFVFRSINRLDRDTSGIVLIAKDQMSAGRLSSDMKKGLFSKFYECIVDGITEQSGVIDAPIEREATDSIKRTVREDGKRALTKYERIGALDGKTKLRVELLTGRTHQIRVHMAYIGHPVTGDFLYGNRDESGYYLRCIYLSFPHPKTGEIIEIRA